MMKLTAENVQTVLRDCLFETTPEDPSKAILARGVVNAFGFVPEKIAEHQQDIIDMLSQLPDTFQEKKGGGMSFLNACMTQEGEHWAEHPTIDELICLGLAVKRVHFCMPVSVWPLLPGGVPYFVVTEEDKEDPWKEKNDPVHAA